MYELRDYQAESVSSAWRDLCSKAGNPVIVLPTGAGKSLVVADLARKAREASGRVLVLAHRKELIEQNAEKVRALLPDESVGLFSSGLRRWNSDANIVLAGIQSAHKKAEYFGERHLVLIDEVHLVPADGEGMYRKFLDDLRRYNQKLRMVGLTATPYRTGEGSICGADKLFQRICHEVKVQPLIAAGYLSPLVSNPAAAAVDCSSLRVRGGEFIAGEMESLFDDSAKVSAAVDEIIAKTQGRQSILVFCAGVAHAQHVTERIAAAGESVAAVTGGTTDMERAGALSRFRAGQLRFLVNCDVLTTGFDAPNIDAIAILRATQSPGLFVQICGRGFRKSWGKENCLILDFGGNIERHGPVDAVDFGRAKKGSFGGGEAPAKVCPNCEEPCPASVLLCEACGWRFPPRELKHDETASAAAILSAPEVFTVEEVRLSRHKKRKGTASDPDTLRVDYLCKGEGNIEHTISEWVCLEHMGFAFKKAMLWWRARSRAQIEIYCHDYQCDERASLSREGHSGMVVFPSESAIDMAISLWQRGAVAMPSRLTAQREGKFWKILSVQLDPIPETWSEEVAEVDFEPAQAQTFGVDELPF